MIKHSYILCFALLVNVVICEESRAKRSPDRKQPWELNPNIDRDQNGNVRTDINVKRNGESSDIEAGWSKVVHGPNRAKPTWHVGGTVRWRRSAQENEEEVEDSRVKRSQISGEKKPWEWNENLVHDRNGNLWKNTELRRTDDNSNVQVGWSEVVGQPAKQIPIWHLGTTIRFRRSTNEEFPDPSVELTGDPEQGGTEDSRIKRSPDGDQPWALNPNVARDANGNVITDINIKRSGKDADFEAGWSKVVHGPNRAKPTWHVGGTVRWRRSADDSENEDIIEESRIKRSPDGDQPWALNPNVARDANGNVITDINIKRSGEDADFEAGWSKVVDGPNRAKPTWHVGGTVRWRRSADDSDNEDEIEESRIKRSPDGDQPWALNPNVARDANGNVITDINIKRSGEDADFEAGWSKVVDGPNRAKPTWHVGGTVRWRRSAEDSENEDEIEESRIKRSPDGDQPWALNPNVARDANGNVITDINIKRSGEDADFEAGWSKVVDGPNRAKPTWHVGGTVRWRRSADDSDNEDEIEESRIKRSPDGDQPWALNPNVARDANGNVITDINIKRSGEDADFEAGWSKVVDGPNRAKPTWHVGGTVRWRRSAEDSENEDEIEESRIKRSPDGDQPWALNPNVARDANGNVITDINIKRSGEDADFEAGWSKVVDGPNRAKPTWHVGGTVRWRRSADDSDNEDEIEESRIKRSPDGDQPWALNPNVARDANGNVITDINIKRTGQDADFEAGWSKVVDGPNRAKPTWHVGGTVRWRRSAEDSENEDEIEESRIKRSPDGDQPWALNPNVARDANGNVITDINIKRSGEDADFEAGWSKVVDGPNRAKPTWHVGGTVRWRRSAEDSENEDEIEESRIKRSPDGEQPWALNPNVARDANGNVITDINIKRSGKDADFEAGWSKVVDGPNRAKPTWHVGGTVRWRRSADDSDNEDEIEESRIKRSPDGDQPWALNPNVARDANGNVITDINIKRSGKDADFEAGWSKVVHGPNRAKPTWQVGGTLRWRRSADDSENEDEIEESRIKRSPDGDQPWALNPNVARDANGNVITDINIKRTGQDADFEAGWSKVVDGPNRAKPTWHVGGTVRWRRSTEDNGQFYESQDN